MSAHTPGPWEHCDDVCVRAGRDLVALCYSNPSHADNLHDNARLIAAAPELLDALQDALCALECCGKDYPAATKARAVIAKAIGEQA